jgi:hypothetical protein
MFKNQKGDFNEKFIECQSCPMPIDMKKAFLYLRKMRFEMKKGIR